MPCGLVRNKEEGVSLCPRYRCPQSAPRLRAAEFSSWHSGCVRKEIIRIQCFVAAEIIGVPMKLRSSRSGLGVYVRACSSALLSIVQRSLDLELLNGIRSGDRDPRATERGDLCDVAPVPVRIQSGHHECAVT